MELNLKTGILNTERLLPDDYPIFAGYLYVADAKVVTNSIDGTVADLKKRHDYKTIYSCDIQRRALWSKAI